MIDNMRSAADCWIFVHGHAQVDFLPKYAEMLRDLIIKGVNSKENAQKPLVSRGSHILTVFFLAHWMTEPAVSCQSIKWMEKEKVV